MKIKQRKNDISSSFDEHMTNSQNGVANEFRSQSEPKIIHFSYTRPIWGFPPIQIHLWSTPVATGRISESSYGIEVPILMPKKLLFKKVDMQK